MAKLFKKFIKKIAIDWEKDKTVVVEKLGVILRPTDNFFEKNGVLNPACYQEGEFVHMFYRAVDNIGHSTIGYAKLKGPTDVVERKSVPAIVTSYKYESKGIEDPRITKIGKLFYMTYVAYDGKNAMTAYATSSDLKTWKKSGIISPQITYHEAISIVKNEWLKKGLRLKDSYLMFESFYEELAGKGVMLWFKDACLFPKKIKGKFAMLIRILPEMQIVYFDRFEQLQEKSFWHEYLKTLANNVVLENSHWFESRNIGGGAVPIYTKDGWLVIFHTVQELDKARIYRASAALLDLKNPAKIIGRLTIPLLSPTEPWEKEGFSGFEGFVNSIVFPSATAMFGKYLYIYYGASDSKIAAARVSLKELLLKLKNTPQI